jgi:hypothetical protein
MTGKRYRSKSDREQEGRRETNEGKEKEDRDPQRGRKM